MDPKLWIGFGFTVILVLFLIVAFFWSKNLTENQYSILKFLSSLCAAFAAGFITGSVLFDMQGSIGANTKYTITGTAGFAFFLITFFFFPKYKPNDDPTNNGSVSLSIPEDWTFSSVVDYLVESYKTTVDYGTLTSKEKKTPLKKWKLEEKTVGDVLKQLRLITKKQNAVRSYDVKYENSTYWIIVKE